MGSVVVIGAGAAGIMAARRAAEMGARVVLLEKTARIGTKILISGGGKCNITHDGPLEDVLRAFRPNEARFIRPACYRFTNTQVVEMLTSRGLRVYTRPDGRIFPVDQTAKDVVAILRRVLDEVGVEVRLQSPVSRVEREGDGFRVLVGEAAVLRNGGTEEQRNTGSDDGRSNPKEQIRRSSAPPFLASSVILAVGGSSYPGSGTTGDGWPWAVSLGHSLVKIRAALAPIALKHVRWREYSGVALRDCVLKARSGGKEIVRWHGDVLFTHFGISGPCALGISREVSEGLERGAVEVEVDLLPASSFEEVSAAMVEYGRLNPLRRVGTYLETLMPERLVPEMLASASVLPEVPFSKLEKKGRNRLVECLKGWKLGGVREVLLDKGEVVAGGVSLDEVDPQTMESRVCPGLFLCGEALDIAGPVGGYNLQAAFATGWVAGESAALRVKGV